MAQSAAKCTTKLSPSNPLPSRVASGLVIWPTDQLRGETGEISASFTFIYALKQCLICAIGGVSVGRGEGKRNC